MLSQPVNSNKRIHDIYMDISLVIPPNSTIRACSYLVGRSPYFHNIFVQQSKIGSEIVCDFAPYAILRRIIDDLHGLPQTEIPMEYQNQIWCYYIELIKCAHFLQLDTRPYSSKLVIPSKKIRHLIELVIHMRNSHDENALNLLRRLLPDDFLQKGRYEYPYLDDSIVDWIFPEKSCGYRLRDNKITTRNRWLRKFSIKSIMDVKNRSVIITNTFTGTRLMIINPYKETVLYEIYGTKNVSLAEKQFLVYEKGSFLYAYDVADLRIIAKYSIQSESFRTSKYHRWNFRRNCIETKSGVSIFQTRSYEIFNRNAQLFFIKHDKTEIWMVKSGDSFDTILAVFQPKHQDFVLVLCKDGCRIVKNGEIIGTISLTPPEIATFAFIQMHNETVCIRWYNELGFVEEVEHAIPNLLTE